jgi:hypothetical protein
MDSIALSFGDGADGDTFDNVFGHLSKGYVIRLNGTMLVCTSTRVGEATGLAGQVFDGKRATDERLEVPWDEIESVHIY